MSRIGFYIISFIDNGFPPSVSPLNGWFLNTAATAAIPDFDFPRGISMDEAIMLCWRAKNLTFIYDVTLTPDDGDPVDYNGSYEFFSTSGPTTETDLLTIVQRWQGSDDNSFVQFDMGNVGFDGTLIYPFFVFSIGVGPILDFDTSGTITSVGFTSVSIPSLSGLPVYTSTDVGITWSGTINLEITEYWTYDGIWDATTGAQLISPIPEGL